MSFSRKQITVSITLGLGAFGSDGSNTVTLTGHRAVVNITNAGGDSMGALQLRMYGLPEGVVNQLTTIGPINTEIRDKNFVTILAGDNLGGMSEVFVGTIDQAWGDYQSAPDVSFNVTGFAGLIDAVKPVSPSSFKGPIDVATIMQSLANTMGVGFEGNGVHAMLSNPYLPGTAWQQVQEAARAADIRFALDRGVLSIWPKSAARNGGIPVVSPGTGMVGYPAFSSNGMSLNMQFNPNVQIGGRVRVEGSSVGMANGLWNISSIAHNIESERPNGAWFTQIQCFPATQSGGT